MKVVFLGTPEFAVGPLRKLIAETEVLAVYSQPDKPVGRGLKMQASPVKQVALENKIPVFTPEKISTPEEVERLKSFAPDFMVVVAYGQILKMSVIEARASQLGLAIRFFTRASYGKSPASASSSDANIYLAAVFN